MNDNDIVLFYAEYMKDGHKHYAVNLYNRVTGFIEYPFDHIFERKA